MSQTDNGDRLLRPADDDKVETMELEVELPEEHRCGYGSCTPQPLQYLHNAKCLVLCLSLAGCCLGVAVNGLVPISITTLERRFDLSSTQTGLFAGAYKLASMCTMLPVAYLATTGHKGRYLGFGTISLGVGSLVICMSQLLSGNYEYGGQSANTSSVCQVSGPAVAVAEAEPESRLYFVLLFVGQLLHGCGGAPIVLLAVTFIDENVSQMASPVYSGVFMACRNIIGPAIGYIFGGMSLKLYGDFLTVDMDDVRLSGPDDDRWYGAWWLGFMVNSMCALLVSIPIFGFGRQLPEARQHRAKDIDMAHRGTGRPRQFASSMLLRIKGGLSLLSNPTFTASVLTQCAEAFMMSGLITFSPKIVENVFGHSSSASSLESGIVLLTGGLGGTLLGGFLIRHLRLKAPGIIKLAILSASICVPSYMLFMITCEQLPFAGVDQPYLLLRNTTNQTCNVDCDCGDFFEPLCDPATQTTFYSPCLAACTEHVPGLGYTSCLCAPDATLLPGRCHPDCNLFVWFCVAYAIYALIMFTANIPIQQTVLRSVEFEQRTLAMGAFLLMDGVGNLLGAVIMGGLFDSMCLEWSHADVGSGSQRRSCVLYDNERMLPTLVVLGASLKVVSVLLLLVAYKFYKAPVDNEVRDDHISDASPVANKQALIREQQK